MADSAASGSSGPAPLALRAVVKSIQSGDTLNLQSRNGSQTRSLHLAHLQAPRPGNRDRADEAYALQARDFLRTMLVGKEVSFEITYTVPGNPGTGAPQMEFGDVVFQKPGATPGAPDEPAVDVGLAVVQNGCAKVRESRNVDQEGSAEQARKASLREAEDAARAAGKGIWADEVEQANVGYNMPDDPDAFLAEHGKGKKLDACIEAVNNGSTVRARLQTGPNSYQVVNVAMAGCRAPRAKFPNATSENANPSADSSEPFGDEARFFTEARLLQRNVQVQLVALPPTPISAAASAPSFFIGHVIHPAGNIAALLTANGLARCVDQHAALLGAQGMAVFRSAEQQAKAARKGVWSTLPAPPIVPTKAANGQAAAAGAPGPTASGLERQFDGVVSRVWSADSVSVRQGKHGEGEEIRLFLSSIRQPRAADTRLAGLRAEALEYLRKRAIGKHVSVTIDGTQEKTEQFDAKTMATVKLANGSNLAEGIVERGYANVIRHRQNDEDKSSEIDKLMEVEAKAQTEKKGLHSGKEYPLARIGDASESASKANSFLPGFKRAGRIPVVVDYIPAGSRFKLLLPKQDVKITFVLSGIRAPRTARNQNERAEPYGPEALDFTAKKCFQRDAEIEVEATDKVGGFIGTMYINKENVAALLTREGLARVDEYNATALLKEAEQAAKREKKNIWHDYDAEAEQQASATNGHAEPASARKEYVDVIVSDVRSDPSFSFAVQILQPGGKLPELEKLMADFAVHHRTAQPAQVVPRSGDLVAARFSADNQWYRARVRKSNPAKKQADVLFYDYGNSETLAFDRLRPLDAKFKSLPPQAKEASLSFVTLLGSDTEYGVESIDLFRHLCEGRPLVANIDRKDTSSVSLTLFDASTNLSQTSVDSLNVELVRNGLGRIDRKSPLRAAYPNVVKALDEAVKEAKRNRAGAFELGDIFDDE